jgi:hypothetical protein
MPAELLDTQPPVEGQEIVDLPPSEEVLPEELVENLEASTEPESESQDELPEKYRDKSLREVVAMHQEAEKVIGRHSGEVGELRQFVDGYIKGKLQEETVQEPPTDFFEDPEKAVNQAIQMHPAVQQAQQQAQIGAQQAAMATLREKHPDMQQVLGNSDFVTWVQASPVRTELFQRADKNYDVQCADELISTFKERNKNVQQAQVQEQVVRKQAIKTASTGSASGANTGGSKRIYRRADIIKLMKEDPDRYDSLSNEILQAYADGRVK